MTCSSSTCRAEGRDEIRIEGLCRGCAARLARRVGELPALYRACEGALSATGEREERVSGSGPGRSLPFDPGAADARSSVVELLVSWSLLVVDERGVPAPARTVVDMVAFLTLNLDWLARHDAAADALEEFTELVEATRSAAAPDRARHLALGACSRAGCEGSLTTVVRSDTRRGAARIRCSADVDHEWTTEQWLRGDPPAAGAPDGPAKTWYSVGEIEAVWSVSTGSIYRIASERGWRRRKRRGRVFYHRADVVDALGT